MIEEKIPQVMPIDQLPKEQPKYVYGKRFLSEQDKQNRAQTIAFNVQKVEDLEEEKKAFSSDIKTRIEVLEKETKEFGRSIAQGYEHTDILCKKVLFPEYDYKGYYNAETGELVKIEPMKGEDYQSNFNLEEEQEEKPEVVETVIEDF